MKYERHFKTGEEMCAYLRGVIGPTVVLAFSMGKDALASFLRLRRHFENVVPVYRYYIPGLPFVEDNLRYYEDKFGVRIHRYPHGLLMQMLLWQVHQPPLQARIWQDTAMHWDFNSEEMLRDMGRQLGVRKVWQAEGSRAADSMRRRFLIEKHGAVFPVQRKFLPVFEMSTQAVLASIREAGLKLPSDYLMFKRTFEGLKYSQVAPIAARYPRDFELMQQWFPLLKAQLLRMKFYREEGLEACSRTAKEAAAAATPRSVVYTGKLAAKWRKSVAAQARLAEQPEASAELQELSDDPAEE